jgi:hypothetical protein
MVHVRYGTRTRIRRVMLAVVFMMAASIGISVPPASAQTSYTCFPTCSETDARFLSIAGTGLKTLAGQEITMTVTSSGNAAAVEIGIFDGESGGGAPNGH